MAKRKNKAAAIPLTEYQRRWLADASRFKIGLMSRQSGKSFGAALEAVLDCFSRKTKWVFLSAGERQSKELMAAAATHARAIEMGLEMMDESFKAADGTEYKQLEIVFANGSRVVGLPANPDTARGHSANILLDEFAFHKDSRGIWRAMFPTVTRGWKLRVISTPQGRQNKFYELWSEVGNYSKHKVTIHDAVSQGLELKDEDGAICSPEALAAALADPEGWRQEYLCEFLDEATAFLTYEMIAECEVDLSTAEQQRDWRGQGLHYLGVDVGRKKDLTVLWMVEQVGDVFWTRRLEELEKTPFRDQKKIIWALIDEYAPHRVCMDATGLGMQLAEETQDRYGAMVEPVTFTLASKEDIATTMRRRFEDKQVRIPIDRKVRDDLHSVKRKVTSAGNIRYDAERTKDGHADRFWALGLALHAASNPSEQFVGVMPVGANFRRTA